MSLLSSFRELDRKFAWSFLGFMLALVFGSITVYDRFLADKNPQLLLDVQTSTAVLDIREDVGTLDILFGGINIKEKGLSLRIITVKVVNDSSRDLIKTLYDPDDPVGFSVSPGQIIRADVISTSNDYLSRHAAVAPQTNSVLHFNPVILEAGQSFVVKLLVLHPARDIPVIAALGHIAGIPLIRVRESYKEVGTASFWASAFAGGPLIHAVRLPAYAVGLILLIALIAIPSIVVTSNLQEWRRKRTVRDFKSATSTPLNESDEFIFTTYVDGGSHRLLRMHKLATDQNSLEFAFAFYHRQQEKKRTKSEQVPDNFPHQYHVLRPEYLMQRYIQTGFVKPQGETVAVDPHMADTLNRFVVFLRNRNLLSDVAVREEALMELRAEHGIDDFEIVVDKEAEPSAAPLPRAPQPGRSEGER